MLKIMSRLLIFIALSLALFGCFETEETPTEPVPTEETPTPVIPTDPYVRYGVSAGNFESFFKWKSSVYKNDFGYHVEMKIELLESIDVEDLEATLVVYVQYYLNSERQLFEYIIDLDGYTSEVVDLMRLDFLGNIFNVSVFYVEVEQAQGEARSLSAIEIKEKTYQLPTYEEGAHPIVINDPEKNQTNYEALLSEFSALDEVSPYTFIYATESISKVKTLYQTITTQQTSLIKADLFETFYIEYFDGTDTYVFLNQFERLFLYHINPYYQYEGIYRINPQVVSDLSLIDGLIDLEGSEDEFPYAIDPSIMLIEMNRGNYVVTGLMKDILPKADYDLIVEVYGLIGVPKSILEKTTLSMIYGFSNSEFLIHTTIYIPIHANQIEYVEITTTEIYYFGMFEKIDIFDESLYMIYPPDTFEEAVELSDPVEGISSTYHPANRHFYYVYLEEGQYMVNNPENSVFIELYDMNYQIKHANPFEMLYSYDYIFVYESGYYYLEVRSRSSASYQGYQFALEKLPYETLYNFYEPIPLSVGTQEVTIEGQHDFVHMTYEATEPTLLKLSNLGEGNQLNIRYNHPLISGFGTYHLIGNQPLFLEIPIGKFHFIINSSQTTTHQFEVEKINVLHDRNNVVAYMRAMPDAFDGVDLYVSDILGSAFLKLEVHEKSFVQFKFKTQPGLHHPAVVFSQKYNPVFSVPQSLYSESQGIILEAGTYILEIASQMASGGQIHYVMEPYADLHIHIEIEDYETLMPYNADFPTVLLRHYDRYHNNFLHFELTEESIIFIEGTKYEVFTENHDRVTILYHLSTFSGGYIKLDAGTYYIKTYHKYSGYQPYPLKIARITGDIQDDNFHGSQVHEIGLGVHTFTRNNSYDQELIKIHITEQAQYTISSNLNIHVYDQQGTFVFDHSGQYKRLLTVGTYYIYLQGYSGFNQWTFSITK